MTTAAAIAMPMRPTTTNRTSIDPSSRGLSTVARFRTRCATCNLRELCLPCGLQAQDMARLDEVVYTRKRVKRGETLYRSGETFESLYAVRSGFFKASVVLEDGRDQVTAFHMAGEIVGMDGIGTDRHSADVIALEDSEVCVIPYGRLRNRAWSASSTR